jgi:hypothetical protein
MKSRKPSDPFFRKAAAWQAPLQDCAKVLQVSGFLGAESGSIRHFQNIAIWKKRWELNSAALKP